MLKSREVPYIYTSILICFSSSFPYSSTKYAFSCKSKLFLNMLQREGGRKGRGGREGGREGGGEEDISGRIRCGEYQSAHMWQDLTKSIRVCTDSSLSHCTSFKYCPRHTHTHTHTRQSSHIYTWILHLPQGKHSHPKHCRTNNNSNRVIRAWTIVHSFGQKLKPLFRQTRIPSERACQEEQNGANFSSVAPSSEELWAKVANTQTNR